MKYLSNIVFFLLWLLLLTSCRNKSQEAIEEKLLGEWVCIGKENKASSLSGDTQPTLEYSIIKNGYGFYVDNVCDVKLGFFKVDDSTYKSVFLGTKTIYKVEDDSLKIFNLVDSNWISAKIVCLNKDTLSLEKKFGEIRKYLKMDERKSQSYGFDELIVSSSGCFGSCPINNTLIKNDGTVYYYGVAYNAINGHFISKVDDSDFSEIERKFKKSNFEFLENGYYADWSDDEEITVTFVKDNRIVKTISDYGRKAPIDFIWSYHPVRFLNERLQLKPLVLDSWDMEMWVDEFESKDSITLLFDAEKYYLWTKLLESKTVSSDFKASHRLINREAKPTSVGETDGRYFRFKLKNGRQVTLDLGFNFLQKNRALNTVAKSG